MTRVLIVDDHAPNLYLLRALLQGHGYEVDEARHGAEALVRARSVVPDLIVSDLLMPVMDGYTLLRHWKGDDRLKLIPFLVYTATYIDPQDERLALSLGADAFIVKPAEPEEFMEHLRALLWAFAHGTPAAVSGYPKPDADHRLFTDYNEVLVRKLEKRADQLATTNRELAESEERFRATFEQAAVGLAHIDLSRCFVRVNDKLCDITGYSRDELLQLKVSDLTKAEDLAEGDAARVAMIEGSQASYSTEKRYVKKNGELIWVQLVSTPVRDSEGRVQYFISVTSDISQRRQLQDQLRQVQKLDAIGQLTGGIAHDFNNLLTVILGNTDFLVRALTHDDDLRSYAEMARTAASRGADLTQRLLAFARRQALDPCAVDVNQIVVGMDRMLRRMLPERIDIKLVCCSEPWPALVDPVQLEAAVLNLAINARDAMPEDGCLTIETANARLDEDYASRHVEVSAGEYVLMVISDTGTGIAQDILAKVFDPFFSTKPVGKGTGLGLSMVYGLVKQSGGHVTIYSEPGQGTTVKLFLPRASALDQAHPEADPVDDQPLTGSETILLVEDDELVRRYAEQQLLSLGYRVVAAAEAASALRIIESRADIDLLLTDIVMPGGMNGKQLADAALVAKPRLKVLFSSGYTENAVVHHGRLDRGVHLLTKPYGRLELARKVRMVLAKPTQPSPGKALHGSSRLLILDDDEMVGKVLSMAARKSGFEALLTSKPQDFFDQLTQWQPSHVAIDLSMPEMSGVQVVNRLAQMGITARIIISSGADLGQMNAALDRARELGLAVAGALPKPFSVAALHQLLADVSPNLTGSQK